MHRASNCEVKWTGAHERGESSTGRTTSEGHQLGTEIPDMRIRATTRDNVPDMRMSRALAILTREAASRQVSLSSRVTTGTDNEASEPPARFDSMDESPCVATSGSATGLPQTPIAALMVDDNDTGSVLAGTGATQRGYATPLRLRLRCCRTAGGVTSRRQMQDALRTLAERSRALGGALPSVSGGRQPALHVRTACPCASRDCGARRRCATLSPTHAQPSRPPRPRICASCAQRDLAQLYDDAQRLGGAATRDDDATVAPDVVNRAQRLLLLTGGFDIEAATREAHDLQLRVRTRSLDDGARVATVDCRSD